MREIKFRAWDKEKNQMIPDFDNWIDFYGNYWCPPDKLFDTPNQEIYTPVNQPIIMQYTGLLDKNRKEVYEGDVMGKDLLLEVIFNDGGFCFKNPLTNGSDRLSQDRVGRLEIIGNIYESPELLK